MTSPGPLLQLDRVAGSLTGLLVGDALGVPYEFHAAERLPHEALIDFQPPVGFPRSHRSVLPGTWSDDGAQALVLLDSLLARQGLDLDHFSNGLLRWMSEGFCAVDGNVFDLGIQTGRALGQLAAGIAPSRAGPAGERDNGNGSLMRVLPLALWHNGSDLELCELSAERSLPTHGHMRSRIACALYRFGCAASYVRSPSPGTRPLVGLRCSQQHLALINKRWTWCWIRRTQRPSWAAATSWIHCGLPVLQCLARRLLRNAYVERWHSATIPTRQRQSQVASPAPCMASLGYQ